MRIDAVLDSFYVLGALWGGLAGPQVCPAGPAARPLGPRAGAAVTAFVNVNVIPMDTERLLADHTVLVAGGRITALGPASRVTVPPGAVRIDGRGKYLIPGLANMHWHSGPMPPLSRMRKHLDEMLTEGVTTLRGGLGKDGTRELKRILQEGPSPRVYLAWSPGIVRLTNLDSLDAYLAAAKAAGYTHIGPPAYVDADSAEVMDSLAAAARRARLPISTHLHRLGLDMALKLGVSGGAVDHLYLFKDSKKNFPMPASQVRAIAAALKQAGVWVVPTVECWWGGGATDRAAVPQVVTALRDAGVPLLLGFDSFRPGNELKAMVQAGLTPYQALLTGTRNVAQYFGVQDSGGTVAVGKWADLVLLDGNPLADIDYVQGTAGVMIAGQWIDLTEITLRKTRERRRSQYESAIGQFYNLLGDDAGVDWIKAARTHRAATEALIDSLLGGVEHVAYQQLLQHVGHQLGAYRAALTPAQQAPFDSAARQWLRLYAADGYQVTISGVRP